MPFHCFRLRELLTIMVVECFFLIMAGWIFFFCAFYLLHNYMFARKCREVLLAFSYPVLLEFFQNHKTVSVLRQCRNYLSWPQNGGR